MMFVHTHEISSQLSAYMAIWVVSRISTLERQLMQLTSTLSDETSGNNSASSQSDPFASPPGDTTSSSRNSDPDRSRSTSTPFTASSVPANNPPPNGLTWKEATAILGVFRRRYMPRFPCVLIDPDMTSQQLLASKPFTFRAVMLVAAPVSVSRYRKMKRNVLAYLGHRMLVEEQRHLDLLQGLLILLTWYVL